MKLKENDLMSLKTVRNFAQNSLNHPEGEFFPSVSLLQSSEGYLTIRRWGI
jgi:hypothetical protein